MLKLLTYLSVLGLTVGLGFTGIGLTYQQDNAIPADYNGQHVQIDDVKLRYYQSGKGPDVLLIHGSMGGIEDWETLIPLLEKKFRVTAFDRIGHGFSSTDQTGSTLEHNAYLVTKLIEELKLDNVVVVGHSYGGAIALKLAVDKVPQIKAYVLLAPKAFADLQPNKLDRILAIPGFGLGFAAVLAPVIAEDFINNGLERAVYPDRAILPQEFFRQRVRLWSRPGVVVARAQQVVSAQQTLGAMESQYPNIDRPVYILQGKRDSYQFIRERVKSLAYIIPNAKLEELTDVGHYIQYRQPQAILKAVKRAHAP